jgi:hypothetical protein
MTRRLPSWVMARVVAVSQPTRWSAGQAATGLSWAASSSPLMTSSVMPPNSQPKPITAARPTVSDSPSAPWGLHRRARKPS